MRDEKELVLAYQNGDEQALVVLLELAEPMFLHFIKEVRMECDQKGINVSEEDIEDALSEAKFQYIRCINNYDEKYNVTLKTYAWNRVRFSIRDVIMGNRSLVRIPRQIRQKCYEYMALIEERDNNISDDEICDKMAINTRQLKSIRNAMSFFDIRTLNDDQDFVVSQMDPSGIKTDYFIETEFEVSLEQLCKKAFRRRTEYNKYIYTYIMMEIYIHHKSVKEIANDLQRHPNTINLYKHSAEKLLKEYCKEHL